MDLDFKNTSLTQDGYGIGNFKSYSVLEVATIFGGRIKYLPERKGNRLSSEVHIKQTMELGWRPKIDLTEYVQKLKENNWDATNIYI